jgi:DNA (cytosine-5)-methyltransferase 1
MPTSEVLADAEDVGRQRSRRARDGWDGPPHRRPTFGSLFAGIGGIDLGLERAGWDCRFQVEWDPFCQRVLAKHWPDVPRFGDITAVDWSAVEPVDLLAGGFPCQPFSVAGKQRRLEDDRWLWPEFARTIRELRPRFVLVENVPGLLVGGGMGAVLGDLAELGFDASWESIPAAAVGAPHLRYRVWIVAYAAGIRGPSRLAGSDEGHEGCGGEPLDGDPAGGWTSLHAGIDAGNWSTEPDVGRVAHGVPARVDRLRSLGNAVVPQVVEYIGRRLMEDYEG